MQNTSQVASALREVAALLEFSKAPQFKVKAYRRAVEVVNTVGDLAPLVEQGKLGDLPGIGPSLSRQIQELWNTGSSPFLVRLRSEQPEGASEMVQVDGMTPRRLRLLVDALSVRSVDELLAACTAGRVRGLPGFGVRTEARLLEACERWLGRGEETPDPTLLSRALERAAGLEQALLEVVPRVQLVGSLRRGEETVRELEWVVQGDAQLGVRHLSKLRQVLRAEPRAGVAYLSEALTLRLHPATSADWGNRLVLATGSAAHVASLRELGLALDVEYASEPELYASLGLSYVPPELRQGNGELGQAARGGFDDLLDSSDIQGMVHCHTTYSDGKNSIEEMALAAQALGMKYLTVTDHSPSAHYANGVSLERLKRQWDEIAAVQERVQIRVLRGTESDILADGRLDYPDAVLEQFDVVIASIHARHRMDCSAMTARLIRALSWPIFKIWGHGLGRILNHRPEIDCDVPAVLDALAGSRGAIELNADPHRLDLPPAWIPAARERQIPFVISVDAHSTRALGVLQYGTTMARRGGLRRDEVLNTQPAARFAELVRPTLT